MQIPHFARQNHHHASPQATPAADRHFHIDEVTKMVIALFIGSFVIAREKHKLSISFLHQNCVYLHLT